MSAADAAGPVTPLSVSWREWLQTPDWDGEAWAGPAFDAIVVGSGYGGSVAALRLAQKNYRVLVLERGSEYLPGEFPNDFSLLPKFFRINVPTRGLPVGRATGLIEAHLGDGLVGITGNGLGGGSLVNAGVVMKPDADVFAQPDWPVAIRHAHDVGGMPGWFERARSELGVHAWDARIPGGGTLHKTQALQRLGEKLGRAPAAVDVTIDPRHCQRCGDCASGCNVAGAKQSLDRTYLRKAHATGRVQIVTQAEVYAFEPAQDAAQGWTVQAFATDAQQQFLATAQLFTETGHAATARRLTAPMLFFCAGTFGSTQLLQRAQSLARGRLAFSGALGTRVSGNGDSLSWLVGEPAPADAVGQGQRSTEAWQAAASGRPAPAGDIVGPTITAAIDLRRRADHDRRQPRAVPLAQRVVIEDGAVPRAVAQVFHELLATASTLKQLDGWWFRRHGAARDEDPLAASASQARHAQTLLAMGHDGSPARLVWLEASDRSAPYLPDPASLPTYQRQQQIFDRFGCRHVHNPLWQPMPQSAMKLMAGPKPPRSALTVHPLGGCVMGDDPDTSVVDDRGRVWVREPGRGLVPAASIVPAGAARKPAAFANEPHLYRGLYVLDGSIVPTSLGCNPLWTITALAERAVDAIADKPAAAAIAARRGAQRTPRAFPSVDVPVEAKLNESLLGHSLVLKGAFAQLFPDGADARLDAVFHSQDIVSDLRLRRHTMPAQATLAITRKRSQQQVAQDQEQDVLLRYATREGQFDVLPAGARSSGPWLAARSLGEVALLSLALAGSFAALVRAPSPRRLALFAACAVALPILLPFPRTFLTWLIQRGWRDARDAWRNGTFWSSLFRGGSLLKQLVHASEVRVMHYRLELQRDLAAPGFEDAPQQLALHARKRVMYRASVGELLAWLRRPCERNAEGTLVARPVRTSVWNQVMNAQVRVVEAGARWRAPALLAGPFDMGFENLTGSGLAAARRGAKGPMELGATGDTTSGVLALAGYPMLFLRYAFKTRLLDARLPTYSGVPCPDMSPGEETWLRTDAACIAPQLYLLEVPRGRSPNDARDDSTAPLKLALRRYRRIDEEGQVLAPTLHEADCNGRRVVRARAVLLLHAFAQSGLCFTFKTVRQNLAEAFYAKGYEVWILEHRMSTRSGYADEPSSMDQIAAHDIPVAVRHMVDTLARECRTELPLQVSAFAQCLGSASLWMSALSGALVHPRQDAEPPEGEPCLSMLSHAMFSQVHPWVIGSRGTQSKTWLPSLLQSVWKHGAIPFAVRGPQQGVLFPVLDRMFASMPVPDAEARRFEGHEDAAATCRRIRFIEAPLFQHANINDATFGAMNVLFGDANLRLFAHARRFVDRERLVSEDGINRYVTGRNFRRHLAFPVQLLHGERNELFDVRSARRSFENLRPTHEAMQQAFCRDADGQVGPLIIRGHGHVDVLLGAQADTLVFRHVLAFFDACFEAPAYPQAAPAPQTRWSLRAPRVGPFVGWLREQKAAGPVLLRVSFVVDDRASADARVLPQIRVRFRPPGAKSFRTLHLDPNPWQLAPLRLPGAEGRVQRLAWADLPLDGDARYATDWQLFTLHESTRPSDLDSKTPKDEEIDAWLQGHARPAQAFGPVVRPVGASHRIDASATLFHVPRIALDAMGHDHALRFAVGCCRHPGLGLDRSRVDTCAREFLRAQEADPVAFALLVGDQIYADATAGLVDPSSPLERYHERHAQAFDREGLGQLLARMPVYMTPDDHEWIDGYPAGSPIVRDPWPDPEAAGPSVQHQREVARIANAAVSDFQRLQSPLGQRVRSWYAFAHGCARFFVIDSRLGRRRDAPRIVRRHVLPALERWLQQRQDGAQDLLNVIVCGSVVLPGLRMNADPANPGAIDTWQYAPQQRADLLALLVQHAAGRFLLVSGDYHASGAGYVLHVPAEAPPGEGARIVGAALVAPPLYAPMPYANAAPDSVDSSEAVPLGGQRGTVYFRGATGADFARGSGLAVLDVARQPAGGYCVWLRRDLQVWEAGRTERYQAMLCLPPAQTAVPAATAAPASAPAP